MIVQGAILPHAPLLTRQVDGPEGHLAGRILEAIGRLRLPDVDALVVLSPHGRFTGLYSRGVASLRGFGERTPDFEVPISAGLTNDLITAWNSDARDDPLDHGVVVPLSLLHAGLPVVAATLEEEGDVSGVIERGRSFAVALDESPAHVVFVASAHTGAALSERAPLGLREDALDVDRRLIDHLTDGTGDGDAILRDLVEIGGSCGAGPIAAFAELFAGKATMHAYEAPVGVGYLVSTAP